MSLNFRRGASSDSRNVSRSEGGETPITKEVLDLIRDLGEVSGPDIRAKLGLDQLQLYRATKSLRDAHKIHESGKSGTSKVWSPGTASITATRAPHSDREYVGSRAPHIDDVTNGPIFNIYKTESVSNDEDREYVHHHHQASTASNDEGRAFSFSAEELALVISTSTTAVIKDLISEGILQVGLANAPLTLGFAHDGDGASALLKEPLQTEEPLVYNLPTPPRTETTIPKWSNKRPDTCRDCKAKLAPGQGCTSKSDIGTYGYVCADQLCEDRIQSVKDLASKQQAELEAALTIERAERQQRMQEREERFRAAANQRELAGAR